MTSNDISSIWATAKSRVHVACDENHLHTATANCLHGDERDIAICKMAEELTRLTRGLTDLLT